MPETIQNPSVQTAEEPLRLYNPVVCIILTLIFTPMFGALLQGFNWRTLNEPVLAEKSMAWVRVSFFTFVDYTIAEPFIRDIPVCRYLMIALFIGFWISWTLSMGIRQVTYIRRNRIAYKGKFFGRAIMIGAFGWVAYTAFALTLVLFLHLTGIDPLPADAPILQQ